MRDIKFRVYCTYRKQMITIGVDSNASFNHDGTISTHGVLGSNPLMQYTGLKDKNGVEIYEGDKLRDPDSDGYLLIVWNNDKARFEVHCYDYDMYYNEGGGEEFNSDLSCIDTESICMEDIYLYEVIGNIHQTPNC